MRLLVWTSFNTEQKHHLKAPITTAADDTFFDISSNFQKNEGMIFHENCLPCLLADDFHEISYLCYFCIISSTI